VNDRFESDDDENARANAEVLEQLTPAIERAIVAALGPGDDDESIQSILREALLDELALVVSDGLCNFPWHLSPAEPFDHEPDRCACCGEAMALHERREVLLCRDDVQSSEPFDLEGR
jgi:hypothetical protein